MPTYRVTIGGDTYEVASDHDLSDYEVYQYAKKQISQEPSAQPPPAPGGDVVLDNLRGMGRFAKDALPAIGGTAGGLIGGAGGAAFGVGFGGVPGAMGGAALGGAAGESIKQLLDRLLGNSAPTSPSAAAQDIAVQGGVQGASEGVGQAVTSLLPKAAKAVYRGYLKPSLSARMVPKANEIVQTALDEALPISRSGVQTANTMRAELQAEVERVLAQSPETVDLQHIADDVRRFARQRYYKPGADLSSYQQALAVADKIDQHPSMANPFDPQSSAPISLSGANDVKRALDTSIGESQFGVTSGAKTSAEKAGRYSMRQALETKAPEIAPLNARESKLIDAARAISRAVEREANQNQLYGVKSLASGALGASDFGLGMGAPVAAATGIGARGLLHPAMASRVALVGYHLQKELGVSAATATRLATYVLASDQGHE